MDFEKLLKGECIEAEIDEQIVFSQLYRKKDAIWSLLLATGYLKAVDIKTYWDSILTAAGVKVILMEVGFCFMLWLLIRISSDIL